MKREMEWDLPQGTVGAAGSSRSVLPVGMLVPTGEMPAAAVWMARQLVADARFALVETRSQDGPRSVAPWPLRAMVSLEGRVRRSTPVSPLPEATGSGEPSVWLDFSGTEAARQFRDSAEVWQPTAAADPAIWAMQGRGATAVTAQVLRLEADRDTVIATGRVGGRPLLSQTGEAAAMASARLCFRELARRQGGGVVDGPTHVPGPESAAAAAALGQAAGLARRVWRKGRDLALRRVGRIANPFHLRLGHGDVLSFDPADTRAVPQPSGHFWADPFLIEFDGELWCFFEDFPIGQRRGVLAAGRVEGDQVVDVRTVMDQPHHLSFPFVFHHDGAVWMMPETQAAGRLEMWRAMEFPDRWERVATAFEGEYVADAALVEHEGVWWLFANRPSGPGGDFDTVLHLYRVDGPELRRIEPHPLNPVVVDAGTARGGGRVVVREGRLLRMSQDNTGGIYGYGLNVMEITELNMACYSERRVRHVVPDTLASLAGCHHLDAAAGRVVIDARWS